MYAELKKFEKLKRLKDLDIVNFGTGPGYYDFCYENIPVKAFNFALPQQSLYFDYQLLKHYSFMMKKGCIVCIVLPYCIFCADKWEEVMQRNERYYSILQKEAVEPYCSVAHYDRILKDTEAACGISYDDALSSDEMKMQTEEAIVNWKRQLGIISFASGEVSPHTKGEIEKTQKWLKKIVEYCEDMKFIPVIIIPPMSSTLSERISMSFRKMNFYDILDEAVSDRVRVLDYSEDAVFCNPKIYGWPYFLTESAAKDFTADVLCKLGILGISPSDCTGCAACANICVKEAIQMTETGTGFKYPVIDAEKCVRCMRCLKICKSRKNMAEEPPDTMDAMDNMEVYAMRSKDDELRRRSTSGGIFSELAQCILKRGGSVAGAIYAADNSVEHCMIYDLNDLESVRRSKYLQSNINLIYREVKSVLNDKKDVLFCGTPCQVVGLKAFLGKEYDNLYTCDFICRGVSSPKIFAKYLEDLKNTYGSEAEYVWMKNKCAGWHSLTTVIGFENGEKYVKNGSEDSYAQLYLKYNAGIRESCYECRFKGGNDAADITLGDFWGLEDTELDDNLGTSAVICRTPKGRELVNEIKASVFYQKKQPEDVAKGNPCLYGSVEKKVSDADMNIFYDILEKEGYRQAVSRIAESNI